MFLYYEGLNVVLFYIWYIFSIFNKFHYNLLWLWFVYKR